MLQTCKGVVATPERGGAVLQGSGAQRKGHREALRRDEIRQGLGVQEWEDGSIYEGEFLNGLKHGKGKYTWRSGEVIRDKAKDILGHFLIAWLAS